MEIIIDEKIRKEIYELYTVEYAHRETIEDLSMAAHRAKAKFWEIIKKNHPEIVGLKVKLNMETWIITMDEK